MFHAPGFQTPREETWTPKNLPKRPNLNRYLEEDRDMSTLYTQLGSPPIGPWITEECSLWMELPEACLAGLMALVCRVSCYLVPLNQASEHQWVYLMLRCWMWNGWSTSKLIRIVDTKIDSWNMKYAGLLVPFLHICAILNICTIHKRFIKVMMLCCMVVHCHYTWYFQ